MKLAQRRRAAGRAQRDLAEARRHACADGRWLTSAIARHRGTLTVGGGVLAGVLFSSASLKQGLRTMFAFAHTALSIARTPIGALALTSLLRRRIGASQGED